MADFVQQQNIFDGMDDETASLVVRMQLSDISELETSSRGKQHEGELSDIEVAAQLCRQDLENLRAIITDRRMAQSIADAVQLDGPLVAQVAQEELATREDHVLAHRMNGSDVTSENCIQTTNLEESILSKLAGRYVWERAGEECYNQLDDSAGQQNGNLSESSSRGSMRPDPHIQGFDRQCAACQETKKYFDVVAAPCNHEYCQDCLRDLFAASMTDQSLFPPRCCRQSIPIGSVEIFLTKDLKESFEGKKVEFGTPNKTYCSAPACSVFIKPGPQIEGDKAVCPECFTVTCTMCKLAAHEGDCPEDTALQGVLDLAEENNWQRCYSCRRMVELDVGCNHITCHCGAQFCYICGDQWKRCACPQWNEERLLARANVLVRRDGPRLAAGNLVPRRLIDQAVEMLRERHNCDHARWSYVKGPHRCEECHDHLPQFIFECTQCRIQVCGRCKRNRL